jgi:hypothetical protein
VRKFVTRRYPYIVDGSVDSDAQELVVITMQYRARASE